MLYLESHVRISGSGAINARDRFRQSAILECELEKVERRSSSGLGASAGR
jgi:hypothetical protein